MVRAQKNVENGDERSRLKKLAVSRKLVSQCPSKPNSAFCPSKSVMKHDGRDIVKKSQRKNRFLFSFPGLIAALTGGKIGELKDLGTKNPILYLDFPQGQMKLFGTIVYPKNRYLTLQFSKGGKSVVCEDNFDNMIVFSDAWWIGKKDENPEEVRLEFPKPLSEGKHTDYDFKGGAGASATFEQKPGFTKAEMEQDEPQSPKFHLEDDVSEDTSSLTAKNKDVMEVTPVRHSARTAGKKFQFAEASSGEDSMQNGSDTSELMEKKVKKKPDDVTNDSIHATDSVDVAAKTDLLEENQPSTFSVKSKESSVRKRGPLVQATLSSLFEKVEEKKTTGSVRKSSTRKGTDQKSIGSKRNNQLKDEGPRMKGTPIKEKRFGVEGNTKKKNSQVEDDDIEEFSSESEDIDGSDKEWTT